MSAGRCRSCLAPIVWVRTPAGRAMPVDPEPVRVRRDAEGTGTYVDPHVGTFRGTPSENGDPAYVSHFATCPQAKTWRKPTQGSQANEP